MLLIPVIQQSDSVIHIYICVCVCVCVCLVAQSCLTLCDSMNCSLPDSSLHGDPPGKNTGVGCHALLQGIFPTQRSNPGLPHCRQTLYCLSHQKKNECVCVYVCIHLFKKILFSIIVYHRIFFNWWIIALQLVSAVQHHESSVSIHISPLS